MQASSAKLPTRMGFEPTRAEPIGLAVQRLNHSATSSIRMCLAKTWKAFGDRCTTLTWWLILMEKKKYFPRRELNPGLLGESQIS